MNGSRGKQYCRFCCHLYVGDGVYCEEWEEKLSEVAAKSPNRCHSYAYSAIDAFGLGREHKPRQPKKKQCDGQMSLF